MDTKRIGIPAPAGTYVCCMFAKQCGMYRVDWPKLNPAGEVAANGDELGTWRIDAPCGV